MNEPTNKQNQELSGKQTDTFCIRWDILIDLRIKSIQWN